MKKSTLAILDKLDATEWYHSVGMKDLRDVAYVSSWLEAVASIVGRQWMAAKVEAFNELGAKVQMKSREHYNRWNEMIAYINPVVTPLVRRKSQAIVATQKLPDQVLTHIISQIRGICMEAEYSDIVEPGFFIHVIAEIYLRGHFPCGWEGQYPEGRLVVY